MAPSCPIGLKGKSQGRLWNQEWSERGPATRSKALPCKSFEPIGRHARMPARGPPPRNITLPRAWPLLASHVEALRSLSAVRIRSNPPGRNAARSSLPSGFSGSGTSLIFGKSSLIRNDESLIFRKNSLFAHVGNLPLSHLSFEPKSGPDCRNRQFLAKIPCETALIREFGGRDGFVSDCAHHQAFQSYFFTCAVFIVHSFCQNATPHTASKGDETYDGRY